MKLFVSLFLAVMMLPASAGIAASADTLQIGDAMPADSVIVTTTENVSTSLHEQRRENGLLVVFICNTCPWVRKWEDRFNVLAQNADTLEIGVIFLNANEALRASTESIEAMRTRAAESGYTFTYAADANHVIADAFGAMRTPDAYLFDSDGVLRYKGAIDDNARDAENATTYLLDAMQQIATDGIVATPSRKSIGCTIKRVRN